MKKLTLLLVLFSLPVLSQEDHIFEYKYDQVKWKNWWSDNGVYVWQVLSNSNDTTITSKEFVPRKKGFEGLISVVLYFDTLKVTADQQITIRNGFIDRRGVEDSTVITVYPFTDVSTLQVEFIVDLGKPFGKVADTLQFYPYSSSSGFIPARTGAKQILGSADIDKVFICTFDPTGKTSGFEWQGDPVIRRWQYRLRTKKTAENRTYKIGLKQFVHYRGER